MITTNLRLKASGADERPRRGGACLETEASIDCTTLRLKVCCFLEEGGSDGVQDVSKSEMTHPKGIRSNPGGNKHGIPRISHFISQYHSLVLVDLI